MILTMVFGVRWFMIAAGKGWVRALWGVKGVGEEVGVGVSIQNLRTRPSFQYIY